MIRDLTLIFDLRESVVWYESQAKGLGGDFINELESAYEAIAELPGVWPQFRKGFRRYILTRFPFAVIYKQSSIPSNKGWHILTSHHPPLIDLTKAFP